MVGGAETASGEFGSDITNGWLKLGDRCKLGGGSTTATGTAGGLRKVRIFDDKAASRRRIDEVDFGAVKVRVELSLCCEHYGVEVIFCIDGNIEYGIEVESVLHSATSAAENTDAQKSIAIKVLCFLDSLDLTDCRRSY